MRISPLALATLLPIGTATAFVSPNSGQPWIRTTELHGQKNHNADFLKPLIGAFAGLTLAGNAAFAAVAPMTQDSQPAIIQTRTAAESSNMLLSAFGAPSSFAGSSFDTLDFNMPSYEESTRGTGSTTSKPDSAPPAFANPFGSSSSGEDAAAAEDKKEAEAERQAAAAEKKAAAVEQAKKDKAERRAAELQKQRDAVARANDAKKEAAAASIAVPDMPSISMPEFKAPEMPEFKAPEMPEFKAPEMPKFEAPSMPKFDMPSAPKFEVPKFDAPKFDAPKFEAPSAPKFEMPATPKFDMPKFDAPAMPKFDVPKFDAPKLDAPSFPSLGGGESSSSSPSNVVEDPDVEPQEIRDERARAARAVFLDADKEAKAIEAQARAVRNIANEKKKVAKEKKDDACKTHWGGKILCLRPLNSGY